jgi:20S proteasome subunit beta 1
MAIFFAPPAAPAAPAAARLGRASSSCGGGGGMGRFLCVLLLLLLLWELPVRCHATPNAAAIDLGTTLVAIRYDGGLIVGADSRTSVGGTFVSHRATATKIMPLTSHCCVLRSGSAADTQRLASDCRAYCRNREWRYGVAPTVAQIASYLRHAVVQANDNDDKNEVSLLVAGYDAHGPHEQENSCPRLYAVARSGALYEEHDYAAAGSGSAFVLGLLDDEFHQQKNRSPTTANKTLPTQQEAIQLCARAIAGAIRRDGSSGDLIRLAVLDAEGMRPVGCPL